MQIRSHDKQELANAFIGGNTDDYKILVRA